jgi:hypothetical protein
MKNTYFKELTFFLILILSGCSSLMMNVEDRSVSMAGINVQKNTDVAILLPTYSASVKKEGWGPKQNVLMQDNIVKELQQRGINATPAGESSLYFYTLQVDVRSYERGSGVLRTLAPGYAGGSHVNGSAILVTPKGKRELDLVKDGQVAGMATIGDQTEDNIEWFAEALAAKITQ